MKLNVLLIVIFLIIFIPSVQAELNNPSFETGNYTGWAAQGHYKQVVPGGVDGSYNYKGGGSDSTIGILIRQQMDFTGVNNISFWYRGTSNLQAGFSYTIATNNYALTRGTPGFIYYWKDVSSINGVHYTGLSGRSSGGWAYLEIDNFRVDGVGWNPTLSGNVTSSTTGLPIEGASVSIHDDYGSSGSKTAVANETGYYEISNITYGIWRIQAAAFDYDEWHENDVTINANIVRNIEMVYNPTPTEDPTTPVIIAFPPISWWEDEDEKPENAEPEAPDETIIDDIKQFIDEFVDRFQAGIEDVIEPLEDLMEPLIEPIQSAYEEITHTIQTSSFLFILFVYIGALVASLLLFYTNESDIDIANILLAGTIGWILPLIITFSGIISLVFASGILTGLVFAVFGFVIHVLMDGLSNEESKAGGK